MLAVALAGALATLASAFAGPQMSSVDGLIYDLSLATTTHRPAKSSGPVVIVAVDRASLNAVELAATPRVFFQPFWAKLINGLADNGAKTIGFDIIFAYSANRYAGFGGQYDHDFLAALARARDRIVLARTAEEVPALPFIAAVYDPLVDVAKSDPSGIAYTELFPDADGVQRRLEPSVLSTNGDSLPTLSAAILRRAGGPAMPPLVLLAPRRSLESMPTYSFIDVLRCIDSNPDAVRRVFDGKIVLIGTTLASEDRYRTPDRFMAPPIAGTEPSVGCSLARLGASDWGSRTAPGVFVHAAAVEEVLTGSFVSPLPNVVRITTSGVAGLVGAVFGFLLGPLFGAAAVVLLAFSMFGIALLALPIGFWFPVVTPAASAGAGMMLAYVIRFAVEERRRQRVQRAFNHYLAPSIVDRLVENEAELRLGGERREVSIMFADLSGFTALSTQVGPEELMEVTNSYLGLLVAAVEATGGYVDKFIGDAVMGMWGAPVADAHHAIHAARAALLSVTTVAASKAEATAAGRPGYSVKIGLNMGQAVVGNIGAPRRYNYTAIGEMVNIAARLESVPHDYDCAIVIGPAMAAALADRFVVCELDWVRLKGTEEALAVYELVAERVTANSAELAYPTEYAVALALYRIGEFRAAETAWQSIKYPLASTEASAPPRIMATRCARLRANPPAVWDGVYVKSIK